MHGGRDDSTFERGFSYGAMAYQFSFLPNLVFMLCAVFFLYRIDVAFV
jgi:hypothetical protein